MTSEIIDATKIDAQSHGRRGLMRAAGFGAAGVAALGTATAAGLGGLVLSSQPALAYDAGDDAILNFALNLEYLEGNFYAFAAHGHGLNDGLTHGITPAGGVTGGSAVPFKESNVRQYAVDIANDELAHVKFLRSVLGSKKVGQPEIDLQTSFTTLAVAGGLIMPGQTFNPFADDVSFLLGAFIFEDVGVTAYLGALSSISTPAYVEAAGAIMAVEAYHAATIRTLLANLGAGRAVQAISNLRASLSGANDDEGIMSPDGHLIVAPVDSNALAFSRTVRQVLNVAYGAPNASSGLFYPNGIATAP